MANNPTGQSSSNYSGFLSNAGFSVVEERSGNLESVPLFGFEAKEIDNNSSQQSIADKHQHQQQQHQQHAAAMAAMPLNVVTPAWTSSGAYASTDGIISVASKDSMGFLPSSKDKMGQHVHSSHASPPGSSNDTMIGLELGKRTYFEVPGSSSGVNSNNNSATATTTITNSSQSPSPSPAATATTTSTAPTGTNTHPQTQPASQILPKRPRVAGQIPKCQVEGCKTDLSSAKDYHRRHKVCAIHSKAARVIVAGQEQRFCQQCSRFHGLSEFDEGKRSCRRRLAGHNERRRKPQPDPLGLNARFLPAAFQDNRRLGALYSDRSSFLTHPRISGVSALWDECNMNPNAHKRAWTPRILEYEDVSSFEHGALPGGSERQLFLGGMQHSNDNSNSSRSSLFPPHSPKGMIPVSNDVSGPKTHQYFQGSVDPLGQSLSLTSSGAGVLSGLEAIPIGQGLITRVSDSGRALSLQSTSPASVVVSSLDTTAHTHTHSHSHSNLMSDQNLHNSHHIPMAQPLGPASQQHQFEWMNDKQMLNAAAAASNLHTMSSGTTAYHGGSSNAMEKEQHHLERSYTPGLNGVGNYECLPLYSMIHGDMPQGAKPTIDLMQMASAPHSQAAQQYEMGISTFGDLQALRSYESTIFSSQQM